MLHGTDARHDIEALAGKTETLSKRVANDCPHTKGAVEGQRFVRAVEVDGVWRVGVCACGRLICRAPTSWWS